MRLLTNNDDQKSVYKKNARNIINIKDERTFENKNHATDGQRHGEKSFKRMCMGKCVTLRVKAGGTWTANTGRKAKTRDF